LKQIIDSLPQCNRILLYRLFSLLNRIAANEAKTKMPPSNLAIVFGPNLAKPQQEELMKMMDDSKIINGAVSQMIERFEYYFPSSFYTRVSKTFMSVNLRFLQGRCNY
jgi:hypothetical protein